MSMKTTEVWSKGSVRTPLPKSTSGIRLPAIKNRMKAHLFSMKDRPRMMGKKAFSTSMTCCSTVFSPTLMGQLPKLVMLTEKMLHQRHTDTDSSLDALPRKAVKARRGVFRDKVVLLSKFSRHVAGPMASLHLSKRRHLQPSHCEDMNKCQRTIMRTFSIGPIDPMKVRTPREF